MAATGVIERPSDPAQPTEQRHVRHTANWFVRARDALFPVGTGTGEIPAMDGLRAIAVLMVFFYHVQGRTKGQGEKWLGEFDATWMPSLGQMGVILFFVLSGFLLFIPYARAILYSAPRLPSAITFFKRRALRILPAYWTSVVLIAVFSNADWLWLKRIWHFISHMTFLYNFQPQTFHSMNGPYWSLVIEMQFYLLLPLMALFVWKAGRRLGAAWSMAIVVGAALALSLVWRWYFAVHLDKEISNAEGDYRFYLEQLPSLLIIFVFGMACAFIWVAAGKRDGEATEDARPRMQRNRTIIATVVLVAASAVVFYSMTLAEETFRVPAASRDLLNRVGWDLMTGAAWAAILISVMFGFGIWRRLLSLWPLRVLALVSYSFYIWHDVINQKLSAYIMEQYPGGEPLNGLVLVLFPICFLFALGYFHFVEWPYLRKKRVGPPAP